MKAVLFTSQFTVGQSGTYPRSLDLPTVMWHSKDPVSAFELLDLHCCLLFVEFTVPLFTSWASLCQEKGCVDWGHFLSGPWWAGGGDSLEGGSCSVITKPHVAAERQALNAVAQAPWTLTLDLWRKLSFACLNPPNCWGSDGNGEERSIVLNFKKFFFFDGSPVVLASFRLTLYNWWWLWT